MDEAAGDHALVLAVLGLVTIASLPLTRLLQRFGIPAMAGFIAIGMALSVANDVTGFLTPGIEGTLSFLAQVGVVVLLFRVGLESDLGLLVQQLPGAAAIFGPNIIIPMAFVFMVILLWPGLGLVPALFAAVAASATSIGVSTAVWEEAGRLKTNDAALLVDVAELDDLAAVVLLGVVTAIAPILLEPQNGVLWQAALSTASGQIALLIAFCAGCYGFSRLVEKPLTAWFGRLDGDRGPLLFATGATFLIAAAANLFGVSVAIGALFAGLAFSRDPAEAAIDRSFGILFAVFAPFFFVAIGLAVDAATLGPALWLGLALFTAAALGKLIGAGVPAALLTSPRSGLLIGLSMVPRAEIFLIVMLQGVALGAAAVPPHLYTAAVFTSLATCIFAPVAVSRLLATQAKAGA